MVEVRAQFVDRGEPHHAFGHLRLDRAVGIQRVGHAVDHTRFEDRHRRLILVARHRRIAIRPRRSGVRLGKRRWRTAAPQWWWWWWRRRRCCRSGLRAVRLRPGVVECRRRRYLVGLEWRRRCGRRRMDFSCRWIGRSRLGALAFLARRRGKQQIALRLDRGRCLGGFRHRRRLIAPAIASRGLVLPWRRRSGRRGRCC